MSSSQAEAVRDLESGHAALQELFARLSDQQMEQPATIGGGDWSAKDLLGHIAAWEQLALLAAGAAPREAGTELPGEPGWPGVDEFNARVQERVSRQPLEEVRRDAADNHAALVRRISTFSDDEWQARHGDKTLGDGLGSLTGGARGPFRHAEDHLADLEAFAQRR